MTLSLVGFAILMFIAFLGFPLGFAMMLVGFVGFAIVRGTGPALVTATTTVTARTSIRSGPHWSSRPNARRSCSGRTAVRSRSD